MTTKYEAVMVFTLKNGEEAATALQEKFQQLIADNGTVESVDAWGKRRLAYEIDYQAEAYYVLYNFESSESFPEELYRVAKITDGVLRTLIVKK